jgi:two-component system chemotaxis response regulator CheB
MGKRQVRVLVLDASPPRRARLQRLLEEDGTLQVVGQAASAEQAIGMAERVRAEAILAYHAAATAPTVAWIEAIMRARPLPLVVASAASAHAEDRLAFELLQAGALAVLPDPAMRAGRHAEEAAGQLVQALRLMADVKVVRRWAGPQRATAPLPPTLPARSAAASPAMAAPPARRARRIELVAIGASTGGPVVLKDLLSALPASFPVPILVVQHMAAGFVAGLANWLATHCAIGVQVAAPGMALRGGCAYLAPDGMHMRLARGGALAFDHEPPVNGHRPAVACLFESVARHCGANAVAVLLTGMGNDGAAELKQLRDAGAVTIAQDRASSAVHGMPGEAIRRGAATYVMTPERIGAALPALALNQEIDHGRQ